ncbi:folliculin-interacting protein 2 isoform X1 [Leptidea sinapis]|uniref:folliculin-interacting protein 2 isoform X1 n=2 Tax=Leptidea sinapis TaxID=189913 RepID=UPI0021C48F96|nr:folliculin-interacting protein 2 isoform X1 [Leptidea sinapis]
MDLLEKIFVTKRKNNDTYRNTQIGDRSCGKALEEVRLLLYKESERSGRKVLFDSTTIEKLPATNDDKPDYGKTNRFPCIVEVSEGFSYLYKGPASDAGTLGEMIFGAVAMNCKSVSLKIHIMNDPKRLMCTKVFGVPTSRRISHMDRRTDANSFSSVGMEASSPLNVPLADGVSMSFSIDRNDSGFYGGQSCSTIGSTVDLYTMFDAWDGNVHEGYSFTSTDRMSSSSSDSGHRRALQSMATRFDLTPNSSSARVPTMSTVSGGDSQVYTSSSTNGTSDSLTSSSSVAARRSKLGLALLITVDQSADMDVIRHCVEHSSQLQSLLCRLRLATLTAGSGTKFVSTLCKATSDAAKWLSDLMFGSHVQPMWLRMVSSEPYRDGLAETLLADMCSVIHVGDAKTTNFFISTLLTHVLTYHLGWVTTVSPYDSVDLSKVPTEKDQRKPYNALWAQLADLCGSIGNPTRTAKTIICGSNNTLFVKRLLTVLTYFVRCGDVKRNNFIYEDCLQNEVVCVKQSENKSVETVSSSESTIKSKSTVNLSVDENNVSDAFMDRLNVPSVVKVSSSPISRISGEAKGLGLKKTSTVTNLDQTLSKTNFSVDSNEGVSKLRRIPSKMFSVKDFVDSNDELSASESELENKVVFTLGDDDKLVGLKNKSNGGKSVKKSSKVQQTDIKPPENELVKSDCDNCNKEDSNVSPTKCCSQTLQHSKPIKHSGFKFEFDKYPQIVTNYMKSKNLEILDRHYLGKPGNLKLDNFQFDPTVVPPIQEERCETCYKCQMMDLMLQTPTNASEMEYMNDMPRQVEPQYAKESIVEEPQKHRELSPKTFVRKRKDNTVVVNVKKKADSKAENRNTDGLDKCEVKKVIELPFPKISLTPMLQEKAGYDSSLIGGISDHYVPDLILQGTLLSPKYWEADLRRDLDLTSYLNKTLDSPTQAVAIVGDVSNWQVRIVGRDCGTGGLSPRIGGMLDALPAMRSAKVPAHECFLFLESKLRELCVLSMTLAELLMSGELYDMASLTASLQVDVNDVPLLLAVASTHTPQLAARYGVTYT